MKEKTVYIVRHAQSADNIAPVFQSPDSPLSERGLTQAEDLASRIAQLEFDTLIASPYLRARQTALAIEKLTGTKAEYSELFVERVKPSSIIGKNYDEPESNQIWRAWEKSLYGIGDRVEDGESFEDIVTRADRALEFLSNKDESSLVVVTHGFFLGVIVARIVIGEPLTGEILRKFQRTTGMVNTGITVIKYRELSEGQFEWKLSIYNDHAHLAD